MKTIIWEMKLCLSDLQLEADQRARSVEDLESMLQSTNAKFQSHIDELQTELSEQKSQYEKELEDMRAEFEATVREKENHHDELKNEIDRKLSIINRLSNERDELSIKCNDICDDYAKTREKEISQYKEEIECLKKQLEASENHAADAAKQLKIEAKDAVVELLEELKVALEANKELAMAASKSSAPSPTDDSLPNESGSPDDGRIEDTFQLSLDDMICQSEEVLQNALCEFENDCSSTGDDAINDVSNGIILSNKPMVEYSIYESLRRKYDALQNEREEMLNEAFALMDSTAIAHAAEIEATTKRVENETMLRLMKEFDRNF